MNRKDFQSLLERPSWSKDVVVWIGNSDTLSSVLENTRYHELDLLDLFPEDEGLPVFRDERADHLRKQLDQKLRQMKPTDSGKGVLRIRSAALLARYGVGLQTFYDWFGGSQTLAVLEIDRVKQVQLPGNLGASVHFAPDWLADYFKPLLAKPDNLCVEVE